MDDTDVSEPVTSVWVGIYSSRVINECRDSKRYQGDDLDLVRYQEGIDTVRRCSRSIVRSPFRICWILYEHEGSRWMVYILLVCGIGGHRGIGGHLWSLLLTSSCLMTKWLCLITRMPALESHRHDTPTTLG